MSTQEVVAALDSAQSAKAAGLRYVSDTRPEIIRKRDGKRFLYIHADGRPLRATKLAPGAVYTQQSSAFTARPGFQPLASPVACSSDKPIAIYRDQLIYRLSLWGNSTQVPHDFESEQIVSCGTILRRSLTQAAPHFFLE